MDINNNPYSTSYKAVRISPHPDKWNQRVLNSVLNSNFVREIVEADAKKERDTLLSFAEHFDPAYPDYTRYNHMFFNIKGNNKDITLGSHSTYRFESAQFLRRAKEIKTGPNDLGKDLAEQIKNLDNPATTPRTNKPNTLESLKKISGKIIIEEPKDYKKFRD